MSLSNAQEAIAAWARFINSGALYHPGPDGYSRPMGEVDEYDLEDLPFWTLVEQCLRSARPSHEFRRLLVHLYWHGRPLATFSTESSLPSRAGPAFSKELDRFVKRVAQALRAVPNPEVAHG